MIINLPTGYIPEVTVKQTDVDEINHKLDVLADELLLLSKILNKLLRGLEAERKAKK